MAGQASHQSSFPLDQTAICFRDQIFLNFVGGFLSSASVFDYFANSPFYDRSCNNEKLRMQGVHPLDMTRLRQMTGVEYILSHAQEPNLFLLRKQRRDSGDKTATIAVYYVLDGSVYQAPPLHAIISTRIGRAMHHIQNAFQIASDRLDPSKNAAATAGDSVKELQQQEPQTNEHMDILIRGVLQTLPQHTQPWQHQGQGGPPLEGDKAQEADGQLKRQKL